MKNKRLWFDAGFGLSVLSALGKRYGKGWEDGVFHLGGINTGHWVLTGRVGRRLGEILALYPNEKAFLDDN